MEITGVLTPGLGDMSYVLASGEDAIVLDPQRDVERILRAAGTRRVRAVLETHVHNDYVSGALELRAATGAEVLGPARAGYAFPFRGLDDGDEITLGDLRVVALATPGHTPEHTAYLVHAVGEGEALAVFTGGSLVVGSAGRTDLLGEELAVELARAQFASLRRLAALPETTVVLPTHGAGSFCASGVPEEARTSTIGRERASNPALQAPDPDAFLQAHAPGTTPFPTYYAHMAPINRAGPPVVGGVPQPPPLPPEEAERALSGGAALVDTREAAAFASAHVPGSLNVPLEDSFASYVGWLVPFGTPVVLAAADREAAAEATVQLFRIGYEVRGLLAGGVAAWEASGRPLGSYPTIAAHELLALARAHPERLLDVRQPAEREEGHVPGSRHCFVGELPSRLPEFLGAGELTVACASGYRAAMAASLLRAAGAEVRLATGYGIADLLRRMG